MKILVTGSDGFIGSHLVERLVQSNKGSVRAFCWYNQFNKHGLLDNSLYEKDIEFVLGDITSYDSVYRAVRGCDLVFHLAALNGIPYSYDTPMSYFNTNTLGTLNILQACKALNVPVVTTSTSEVYGSAQFTPITENHPINPQSPYAASKSSADMYAAAFHKSFDLPVMIVRPFNTYGPRQSMRAVIPTIIRQMMSSGRVNIGNIDTARDFVYVEDTVTGFIKLSELNTNYYNGEAYNIATANSHAICKVIKLVSQILAKPVNITIDSDRIRPLKSEVTLLCGDNDKLFKATGWKPEFNIEQGLMHTIDWINSEDYLNLNSSEYVK